MTGASARLLAAFASGLFAAGLAAAELIAVPPLQTRVTDLTATLTRDQAAVLETGLAQLEKSHGSQVAILLVPSTRPESIEAYALRVAENWKLGRQGIDDGLLIVVAKNDRKLRIEVGRGLEGAVPDAVAKRIVAEVIGPRFKEGDFYGGLQAGVAKVQAAIGSEALPAPPSAVLSGGPTLDLDTVFIVGIVIAIVLGALMGRLLGRLGGSTVTAGGVGTLAWLASGSVLAALIGAVLVFVFVLALAPTGGGSGRSPPRANGGGSSRSVRASSRGGGRTARSTSSSGGSWSSDSGGGWSRSSSDSSFSGGGGDFGGGGASGDW